MSTEGKAARVHDFPWTFDLVGAPFLHRGAVKGLASMLQGKRSAVSLSLPLALPLVVWAYVKRHPADGLLPGNLRLLDQLQGERFVVERDRDDDSRRRPCANHEMMLAHGRRDAGCALSKSAARAREDADADCSSGRQTLLFMAPLPMAPLPGHRNARTRPASRRGLARCGLEEVRKKV